MAEKMAKKGKDGLMLDDMTIELESRVIANRQKVVDNHFLGLMTELLKWEKNAPEVETVRSR